MPIVKQTVEQASSLNKSLPLEDTDILRININTHVPVLIDPILITFLEEYKDKDLKDTIIFDGTFGGGGYSQAFLGKGCKVLACDLDNDSIEVKEQANLKLTQANFANYIEGFDKNTFDLIVVDLGFSNNQLTQSNKGFSYHYPEQIFDLRYDQSYKRSVSDFLLTTNADTLSRVIYQYSGEKLARKIANSVVEGCRGLKVITVGQMVEWINSAIPAKFYNKRNQILSRVWQALRIFINDEFVSLEKFLNKAPEKLKIGGLLCVVNFHSLEDKMTTKRFRELSKTFDLDKYGNKDQYYKLLTKKATTPNQEELDNNKQSRSATLRILQKCQEQNN